MPKCPCCDRPRSLNPAIVGIQYGAMNEPALILYNCPCGTTKAIKWAEATEPQRAEARLVELSRNATCEMGCWG